MLLDAITSSPLNVFLTIVCVGLAYLYYRNSSSSSSSSTSTPPNNRSTSSGTTDEDIHQTIARIERQERDMIRQEQDEAYQQSLRADREKERKRLEEAKKKEADEKERKETEQKQESIRNRLFLLKQTIIDKLPKEPKSKDTPSDEIINLVIKLPDGSRIARKFHKSHPVKYLYWFVFSHHSAPLNFQITTNFPRRELPGRPPLPEDFDEIVPLLTNGNSTADNSIKADSTSSSSSTPLSSAPTTPSSSIQDGTSVISQISCTTNSTHKNCSDSTITTKPNCESTLEETGLSKSEMLFVHDLEA